MKLTVAALALLVVGASYADIAAANKCWHGDKAQAKCDKYVAKHWGSKCEGTGFGTKNPQYCAIPGALPPNPSPAPTPAPKANQPLKKALHNTDNLHFDGPCARSKNGVEKCSGYENHEGGIHIPWEYVAKNLDNPEKMHEQIHFYGKVKVDSAKMNAPLQVNGGGKVKYDAKHDRVKGEGKEKVVRKPGSTAGSTKPIKEKVTYDCSGNGSGGITCQWSDKA